MKGILTLFLVAGIAAAYMYLPAQTREVPAPVRTQPHLAGPGVAFTTGYVALRLANGVVGIAPGTQLTECMDVLVPGKTVVSNGKYTFTVDPQTLTHDIDLAHRLAAADQHDQEHAMSSLARSQEELAANQHAASLLTAQDVDQVNLAAVNSSTVGSYDSALHRPVASVGPYGSYGGSYFYGGDTVINRVTINQYGGTGAGTRADAGAGTAGTTRASKFAAPRATPARGMTGPVAGLLTAPGMGVGTR